jgi:hypothetical protein
MTRNFLLNDRQRLFWALQLGGWAAWGIVGKYLYTRTMLDEVAPNYGLYVAVITVIGLVISLGLRYLYRFLWRRPVWIQAVGFLGGSSVAGYAWMNARSKIFYGWIEKHKDVDAWLEKVGDAAELYERVSSAGPSCWSGAPCISPSSTTGSSRRSGRVRCDRRRWLTRPS